MRGGYCGPRRDTAELDYEPPSEPLAQGPPERRDDSRLLVYDRATGEVRHRRFSELPEELSGELVVVNQTRVIPARLPLGPGGVWEGLARPSRRLRAGQRLGPVELLEPLGGGRWSLRLEGAPAGETPPPPHHTGARRDPGGGPTAW